MDLVKFNYKDITTKDLGSLTEIESDIRREIIEKKCELVSKGKVEKPKIRLLRKSLAKVLTAKQVLTDKQSNAEGQNE